MGSSRGYQAQWEEQTRICSGGGSNREATEQVSLLYHLSPGALAAALVGAQGIVLSPRVACATGLWAIAQGADLIRTGQCSQVIVGAVEAPVTPLTLAGFAKMGALASTGAYPFDRDREGFVLGEGAAILVLEDRRIAEQRAASVYGQILGFGATADGYHCSAPDQDRRWVDRRSADTA